MGWRDIVRDNQRWQERWRDPILTALLVLLSLDVFVIIPLGHFGMRNRGRCQVGVAAAAKARLWGASVDRIISALAC